MAIDEPDTGESFGLPEPPEPIDYETAGEPRTERILIIEDDPDIARFIEVGLDGGGFPDVTYAEDGETGLARIEQENFQVVLTGFMMPGMLGDEVVRRIRANPRSLHLPVIVVTSQADTDHIRRAMLAGADDYVTKPFDPLELFARVRAVLRRRES
jgi:DNA-binding response OmpR family regulator